MPQDKPTKKAGKTYPHELNEKQWEHLAPLLPTPKKKADGAGRWPLDLREVLNGILYVLRTG